ncbi:MAG: transposase, partial [Clostridiales bacterium]|nr:transposase [Clostridiales bacterium]
YYTQEFKDKVIDRLESSSDDTVASLSEEFGISKTAIYHWSKQYINRLIFSLFFFLQFLVYLFISIFKSIIIDLLANS